MSFLESLISWYVNLNADPIFQLRRFKANWNSSQWIKSRSIHYSLVWLIWWFKCTQLEKGKCFLQTSTPIGCRSERRIHDTECTFNNTNTKNWTMDLSRDNYYLLNEAYEKFVTYFIWESGNIYILVIFNYKDHSDPG